MDQVSHQCTDYWLAMEIASVLCRFDWGCARLITPFVTTASSLAPVNSKIGDIVVSSNPGQPGKMAVRTGMRER